MKAIERIIYTGFAAVALASAAMPVLHAPSIAYPRVANGVDATPPAHPSRR